MCTIAAVVGIPGATRIIRELLDSPGEKRAVGVMTISRGDNRLYQHKKTGAPRDVMADSLVDEMVGDFSIGCVTELNGHPPNSVEEIDPVKLWSVFIHCAVVSRGKISNFDQLIDGLPDVLLFTASQSEIIPHLIVSRKRKGLDRMVYEAYRRIEGDHSALLIVGETVYAACSKKSGYPIFIGRRGHGHVLTTHGDAMDVAQADLVDVVEPGEVKSVDQQGTIRSLGRRPGKLLTVAT